MAVNEQIATNVGPSRIEIAYERRGDPNDPVVLLIMGLAAQLVHWSEGLLGALMRRGLQLIRFDNRDAGRSTHFPAAAIPDLRAALAGDLSSATYTLSDMAADAAGLLDALELDAAHVVGASMGGAIAQTIAIEHPGRILSLTSMMSTTGDTAVGQPHPDTLKAVFGGPPATTRQAVIDRAVRVFSIVGSPGYATNPADIAECAGLAWDRSHDPTAIARQAVASVASGNRTSRLQHVAVPALVIHGLADTICDPSGGRATAAAIPGAELVLIDGMGHNLPPGLWEPFAAHIAEVVRRGEAARGQQADIAASRRI
jgi:pimeloyl-ACP methyl ester carboxylesterase